MVRKQTWVLVGIFSALLGVVFYLQKNPLPNNAGVTPSPTSPASLFVGWQEADIRWIGYRTSANQETPIELSNQGEGNWVLGKDGNIMVEGGKAAQIAAQIIDTHISASLPADYSLEAVGLETPASVLSIRNSQGIQSDLKIGNATPTGAGYYVQLDNQTPVVVETAVIDQLQSLLSMENLQPPTPTPAGTVETPQPTAAP
jgi:hypothetical protein